MENKPNENKLSLNKDDDKKEESEKKEVSFLKFIFCLIFLLFTFLAELSFPIAIIIMVFCSVLPCRNSNKHQSINEISILLDDSFIKNIDNKCIINDLKTQIDDMIKSDNEDTKLTFDNYQTAKGKCDKENDEIAKKDKKDKHNQYLEKTKELLDKASQDIN